MLTATDRADRMARIARTTIEVTRAGDRCSVRSRIDCSEPGGAALRPMVMGRAPGAARVSLVPDGALLLAGDHIALDISVAAGAGLELVEPAGTVAFAMRGGSAAWDVRIDLAQHAVLSWAGEPFVVAAGADVRRTTTVRLGGGARLALREALALGRYGEQPGRLVQSMSVEDLTGPVLVESLEVEADAVPASLGGRRVMTSVLALSGGGDGPCLLRDLQDDRFDLDNGGTMWRRLGQEAHLADLDATWSAASAWALEPADTQDGGAQ